VRLDKRGHDHRRSPAAVGRALRPRRPRSRHSRPRRGHRAPGRSAGDRRPRRRGRSRRHRAVDPLQRCGARPAVMVCLRRPDGDRAR